MSLHAIELPQVADLRAQTASEPCKPDFIDAWRDNYARLNALMAELERDPRVQALSGRMLVRGGLQSRFSTRELAEWFSWRAHRVGRSLAIQDLDDFLSSDKIEVLEAIWIQGAQPLATCQIASGIEIRSIEEMPLSRELVEWSETPGPSWRQKEKPTAAVVVSCPCPRDVGDDGASYRVDKNLKQRILDVCLLINAVPGLWATPFFFSSYAEDRVPPGPYGGGGGARPMYDVRADGICRMDSGQIERLRCLLADFDPMSESAKRLVRLAMGRLSQAKRRGQQADQVLDLAICLEALLLDDNEKEQLSLSFRLRGAWLIGGGDEERLKTYQTLKSLYEFRSKVAHGSETNDLSNDDWREFVDATEQIVAQYIRRRGKVVWKEVVLGVERR